MPDATGEPTPPEHQPTASISQGRADPTNPLFSQGFHQSPSERPGDQIGAFTLLEVIGEGGFGLVWLAERREPMVQRVALKIIKLGMDTEAVVARFEQERQALAVMDHPNVARVFDGGVTPNGRPYFVMEYVGGDTITTYADKHRMTLRERLALFIPVCEAVQHAHHKGLIHRDLKPSNVLVTQIEGRPVPKVIDFGVAKAIASAGWTNTAHTQSGVVIGTPEYMSPEQVAGEVDVDTRTDVYSLGVMLYELLTGELPFESRELRKAAMAEMARIIRTITPPAPSARLARLSRERTTTIATARSATSDRLTSDLREELDWIPMMAIRKERERRYDSPQALADDVQRYLQSQPLRAAPDSRAYLARKFVVRNKVSVAAGTAVFAALAAGLAVAYWQRGEALLARDEEAKQRTRADDRAEAAIKAEAAATLARDAEKQRADELKQVSEFQSSMLDQIDPARVGVDLMHDVRDRFAAALEKNGTPEEERKTRVTSLARELSLVNAADTAAAMLDRTILKPAVGAVDVEFKDQPLVDAQLRQALAAVYHDIGLDDAASAPLASALATRRRLLGNEHEETLRSIHEMGTVLVVQGRMKDAEPLLKEAMDTSRRTLGEEHPNTLAALQSWGNMLVSQGKLTQGEPVLRDALGKARRVLGEEDPRTVALALALGSVYRSQGRLEEAEPLVHEALEKSRRVLGDEHGETLRAVLLMGLLLQTQGRLEEAEPLLRESVETLRRVRGEVHPDTVGAMKYLGLLLLSQGRLKEAEGYLADALDARRRVLGNAHPDTLGSMSNMAALLLALDRPAEAVTLNREAMEARLRVLGDEHPDTIQSIHNLGVALQALGQLDEAEMWLRDALERNRRAMGQSHPITVVSTVALSRVLQEQHKDQEVIDLLVPAEPLARRCFTGGNAPRLGVLLATLGRARAGMSYEEGRYKAAETNLLESHEIARKARGATHRETLACARALADFYSAWHAAEPNKGYDAKAAHWKAALDAASTEPAAAPATTKP